MLLRLSEKRFPEAFGIFIQLAIVASIFSGYTYFFLPDFTQKIENFEKEKRYYLRQVSIRQSSARDGKGKLVTFGLSSGDGNMSCNVVYDQSDTLLDPDGDHRELGVARTRNGALAKLPIAISRIEPNFYYVCRNFKQLQPK